jgi:hypothetical protein
MERKYRIEERKHLLFKKYPELIDLLKNDDLFYSWLNSWVRSEKTIEDGFSDLIILMHKSRVKIFNYTEDLIKKYPETPNFIHKEQ